MKFHQLSIGQRFEFAGAAYIKTSPVLANHEQDGTQKFMARSAKVAPLDVAGPAVPKERLLREDAVRAAFDTFFNRCGELAADLDLQAEKREALRRELAWARRRFLDSL